MVLALFSFDALTLNKVLSLSFLSLIILAKFFQTNILISEHIIAADDKNYLYMEKKSFLIFC